MELIREENGTIKKCDFNLVKLGYWRSLRFFGYKRILQNYFDWPAIIDGLIWIFSAAMALLIFPLLPLIYCYLEWSRAKRLVSRETKEKVDKLHKS